MCEVVQNIVNFTPRATATPTSSNKVETNENKTPAPTITSMELTKRGTLDAKALHSLYCALFPIEYKCVSSYETAKVIWYRIHVTFKGTDKVEKQRQISSLENINPSR